MDASTFIEAGLILPQPGEEAAWFERNRAHLSALGARWDQGPLTSWSYSASKPDCSNLSVWAFSLMARTLASSNPFLATAVISRRTSNSTPSTAAKRWANARRAWWGWPIGSEGEDLTVAGDRRNALVSQHDFRGSIPEVSHPLR